ncbi:TetR/AcrR family transcriptional regulator, partial [Staphylococcus aureus]
EHIVKTAIALFGEHGFNGTGVDRIMTTAKVSKKTMYSYFRSKDELILAALQYYDGLFRNQFMQQVGKQATTPRAQLLALFDVAKQWFMQDDF